MTLKSARGKMEGVVKVGFNGEEFDMTPGVGADKLTQQFSSLKNVEEVEVESYEEDEKGGAVYNVKFLKWPVIPHENNIYNNNGNPPLSAFSCNTTGITGDAYGVECKFKSIESTQIKEYIECSNHGKCNKMTGQCACEKGWNGEACDDNTDSSDVINHKAEGPFFTGTVMRMDASRDLSGTFDFLRATTSYGRKDILQVSGNGNLTMHEGDLRLKNGGVSVEGGEGLAVKSAESSVFPAITGISPGGGAAFYGPGANFIGNVVELGVERGKGEVFKFINAEVKGSDGKEEVFVVRGDGFVQATGFRGKDIVVGNELRAGGGGMTVEGGGLEVEEGGMKVEGASNFTNQEGGTTLLVESHSIAGHDAMKVKKHGGEGSYLKLEDGESRTVFEIDGEGTVNVGGGLEVKSGGLKVLGGGAEIESGGLKVKGGITLAGGDLIVEDEGGFVVKGGVKGSQGGTGGSAVEGTCTNEHFSGNVVELSGVSPSTAGQYNFISTSVSGSPVFSVTSSGTVVNTGGIDTKGHVMVSGDLEVNGGIVFDRHLVSPKDGTIKIDVKGNTFIEIDKNGQHGDKKSVVVECVGSKPSLGQVIMIKNGGAINALLQNPGSGPATLPVPVGTVIMFVYTEPDGWADITAAAAHTRDLTGVNTLEAANDLDIGRFGFTADRFIAGEWKDKEGADEGMLVYFGAGGVMTANKGVRFEKNTGALKVGKLDIDEIVGDVDFRGGSVKNVRLVGGEIEGVKHLNVESFGVLNEAKHTTDRYVRVGVFNDQGFLKASDDIMFEGKKDGGGLRVSRITALGGKKLEFGSRIDFQGNELSGVKLEKDTVVQDCSWKGGSIENTVLVNVTAKGLDLGEIEVEGIKVEKLADGLKGNLLIAGEGGEVEATKTLRIIKIDEGATEKFTLEVFAKLDGKGNELTNVEITKGKIGGEKGDVSVVGEVGVEGRVIFLEGGSLEGPKIVGGSVEGIDGLQCKGDLNVDGGANVGGEVFIEGSLTVSGSVLGSGPYVDASDVRFKKDVEGLEGAMGMLRELRGVRYIIDEEGEAARSRNMQGGGGKVELGFIAQEVEEVIPELVRTHEDGYKGVMYARTVPVIVEAVKELEDEIMEVREENERLRVAVVDLMRRLEALEGSII